MIPVAKTHSRTILSSISSRLALVVVTSALTVACGSPHIQSPGSAVEPVVKEQATVAFDSDYQGFGSFRELVAESDLVVMGRASSPNKLEEYSSKRNVTLSQQFEIEKVLLGEAPTNTITLVTSGANPEDSRIASVLANGGRITLPIGGFGGLPAGDLYLVFLQYPLAALDDSISDVTFTIVGSAAQGAFGVAPEGDTHHYSGADVIDMSGKRVETSASVKINIEDEEVRVLSDYRDGDQIDIVSSRVTAVRSSFLPKANPALNHLIAIDYADQGDALSVSLQNGAARTKLYVGICGTADLGMDGCLLDSFQLVALDQQGAAQVVIASVHRKSLDSACKGPCSIIVASNRERYAEIEI